MSIKHKKEFLSGAQAVAKFVSLARPKVICAYPITPQTPIVEELASICASGELQAEFINAESEHSAASIVLGASATGARAFTATSSQGLILMSEVLFNAAGLRIPFVMTCVNRSLSAPLNIWNDLQDSILIRDGGVIQVYTETIQEACDWHIISYKLSEHHEISLPAMVCMDGYYLSHGYEPVDIPTQQDVDDFLPSYEPKIKLDPENPLTLGSLVDPSYYMETRYALQITHEKIKEILPQIVHEYNNKFQRDYKPFFETYKTDDAEKIIIAMGSICGTIKDTIDELREKNEKIGLLKIILYRPFHHELLYQTLKSAKEIAVIDRAISLGMFGPLYTEIKSIFQGKPETPKISGFVCGLGGRDVTKENIKEIAEKLKGPQVNIEFIGIKKENLIEI